MQGFTLSLENTFLEKPYEGGGGGGQIDPPSLFSANNNKSHKLQLILSNTCFLSQSFSVVTIIKVTINNLDDC